MESSLSLSEFVKKSSAGILNEFENDCKKQQSRLDEFLTKQTQVLALVNTESLKFSALEGQQMQLEEMMSILRTCQIRLQAIKERMRKASTKAAKLKARSLKLQQTKQKEALGRELLREAQLTREQDMVAKSPAYTVLVADASKNNSLKTSS